MPYKARLDSKRRVAFVEFSGTTTYREIDAYVRELRVDPAFEPGFAQYIDASGVTDTDMHATELERLATADPFSKQARRVIIAGSDYIFGIARMFASLSDLPKLTVVRTREEALRILDLSTDATD